MNVIAGYLDVRISSLSQRNSVAAGIELNGRGAMELVVAAIGLELVLIDESLFSILVLMGVVTTFLMTLGLRFVLPANVRDRLAFGSSTAEQGSGGNQWRGVTQARSRADRTPQASERRTRT